MQGYAEWATPSGSNIRNFESDTWHKACCVGRMPIRHLVTSLPLCVSLMVAGCQARESRRMETIVPSLTHRYERLPATFCYVNDGGQAACTPTMEMIALFDDPALEKMATQRFEGIFEDLEKISQDAIVSENTVATQCGSFDSALGNFTFATASNGNPADSARKACLNSFTGSSNEGGHGGGGHGGITDDERNSLSRTCPGVIKNAPYYAVVGAILVPLAVGIVGNLITTAIVNYFSDDEKQKSGHEITGQTGKDERGLGFYNPKTGETVYVSNKSMSDGSAEKTQITVSPWKTAEDGNSATQTIVINTVSTSTSGQTTMTTTTRIITVTKDGKTTTTETTEMTPNPSVPPTPPKPEEPKPEEPKPEDPKPEPPPKAHLRSLAHSVEGGMSCEAYQSLISRFVAGCDRSNWDSYVCKSFLSKMRGCPSPGLVLINPDGDFVCGRHTPSIPSEGAERWCRMKGGVYDVSYEDNMPRCFLIDGSKGKGKFRIDLCSDPAAVRTEDACVAPIDFTGIIPVPFEIDRTPIPDPHAPMKRPNRG